AEWEDTLAMPEDSLWPLVLAFLLASIFVVTLLDVGIAAGLVVLVGAGTIVLWPWAVTLVAYVRAMLGRAAPGAGERQEIIARGEFESTDTRAPAWWGMVLFIATEAALFASLLVSYFYLRASAPSWPPPGLERPELSVPVVMTVVLLASSVPMAWADRGIQQGRQGRLILGLMLSFV